MDLAFSPVTILVPQMLSSMADKEAATVGTNFTLDISLCPFLSPERRQT